MRTTGGGPGGSWATAGGQRRAAIPSRGTQARRFIDFSFRRTGRRAGTLRPGRARVKPRRRPHPVASLPHEPHEVPEQVVAVVGTGARLGVVLHRYHGEVAVPEALHRA